ncbi:putative C6 transcription factor [Ilyonectria robusta]
MDIIAKRIEDMSQIIARLDSVKIAQPSPASSGSHPAFSTPQSLASIGPTPASSTPTMTDPDRPIQDTKDQDGSRAEYEGESSLLAHAVFATSFLQGEVNNNRSTDVFLEMTSVLDTLRNIVEAQKQNVDNVEALYPHAKLIPPGSTVRQLGLPPLDKAFACLRMAKEFPQIRAYWAMEFPTLGHFMEYFIKVYSPGMATEADLIIVHVGLYWLFCACSSATVDESIKQDFDAQACVCRDNLETILSRLSFHMPTTMDYACAMNLAASYLIQRCQSFAAWTFITTASRICQTLGIYSTIPPLSATTPEKRNWQERVFWCVYITEKMLSLRLGRTSTIRDEDITLPMPGPDQTTDTILCSILPNWIRLSTLQGRVYDEIYSSRALLQPEHIRTSRARALAKELKTIMSTEDEFERQYNNASRQSLGPAVHQLQRHMDRVTCLSLLTLIYRSIPSEGLSSSAFCEDCIATAKATLTEHEKCIATMAENQLQSSFLGIYVNWSLMQSPFIPFIVLFCEIVETSESSDLGCLSALVETLQSASTSVHYPICGKQFRLFKALYDVAVKYVEVKASRADDQVADCTVLDYTNELSTREPAGLSQTLSISLPDSTSGLQSSAMPVSSIASAGTKEAQLLGGLLGHGSRVGLQAQNAGFGYTGFEMNPTGAELGNWFSRNQEMLIMMEDL